MCEQTCETAISTGQRLLLSSTLAAQLEQQAVRAYPYECCGILIGVHHEAGVMVRRVAAAENIAVGDRRRQYQIDWETLFESVRRTRDSREAIVGFYHSHPDGACQPSSLDHRNAWIDYAYLIVGVSRVAVTGMACWRIHARGAPFNWETVDRVGLIDTAGSRI